MRRARLLAVAVAVAAAGVLAACGGGTRHGGRQPIVEPAYEPRHAQRFRVDRECLEGDCQLVLTVWPPWRDVASDPGMRYLLRPDQAAAGLRAGGERVVRLPVRRLVTTSTTEVAHLEFLARTDVLVGHSELDYVSSRPVRERIDHDLVTEVGGGAGLDLELVLDIEADAVLADFLAQSELDQLAQVEAAGTPIVLVPSFLEATPLGRAEWLVVTGLLLGQLDEAVAAFGRVESAYLELRRQVAEAGDDADAPTVFTGGPFDDVWHVPGGRSFAARFLADAGGRYLWADEDSAGALPLDIETVYERALDADLWLYPSSWRSLGEIRRADSRLASLRAVQEAGVWANDRQLNRWGGNDFWETGAVRPDLVLADLVTIFHPELATGLLPDHQLVYHRRLAEEAPELEPPGEGAQ